MKNFKVIQISVNNGNHVLLLQTDNEEAARNHFDNTATSDSSIIEMQEFSGKVITKSYFK